MQNRERERERERESQNIIKSSKNIGQFVQYTPGVMQELVVPNLHALFAEPHSPVGGVPDLRTGGR